MPRTPRAALAVVTSLAAATTLTACADNPLRTVAPQASAARSADKSKADKSSAHGRVTVMTYNIYQGTELEHVFTSSSPLPLGVGAAQDFAVMHQTNFAERARAIASEVQTAGPDLIGLQEVALWRTGPYSATAPSATTVDQDFLQILLDALAANGLHYGVASTVNNFDLQTPALLSSGLQEIRITDRTVILARLDGTNGLRLTNPQAANFGTNKVTQTVSGPLTLREGWVSVDGQVGGRTFRFIATHLDPTVTSIRLAQVQEILSGPAQTSLPVILVGDMNSTPTSDTYAAIRAAGLQDVWAQLRPSDPGFTCCEVTPTITNPVPTLTRRFDYVFVRGGTGSSIEEIGATSASRTATGLWPSDHAGVVASFGH